MDRRVCSSSLLFSVIGALLSGCSLWREALPPITVSDLLEDEAKWWERRGAWEDAQKERFAWLIGKHRDEVKIAFGQPTEIVTAEQSGGGTFEYGADECWTYSTNDSRYRALRVNFLYLFLISGIVVAVDVV